MTSDRDWKDDLIDEAGARGLKASLSEPDSILMADARLNLVPGSVLDRLADNLADDLAAKAPEPITAATCAVMVRACCNAQGMTLLGYGPREILTVVAAAAAKLEMRAVQP